MDDHQLVAALASDDAKATAALQEVFFRHAQPLINFARRFTLDRDAAEDVVQNVFLALWRNRLSLSIGVDLRAYLYTAVRNQALNHLRHAKTVRDGEQSLRINLPDPIEHVDPVQYEQFRQTVQQAVDSLPEQCKRIFLMSRLDGLTYSQIAGVLELSVKTVETQMGRALKHLRSVLLPSLIISVTIKIFRNCL